MSFSLFSTSPCIPAGVAPCRRPSVPLGPCGIGEGSGVVGYGGGYGSGVSAASLGLLPSVIPSCISHIPPSEFIMQPPRIQVTVPGAVLGSSQESVRVGGYLPWAYGGYGYGSGGYGLGGQGGYLGGGGGGCVGWGVKATPMPNLEPLVKGIWNHL